MKRVSSILFLVAFAIAALFFACSGEKIGEEELNISSSSLGNPDSYSSDSGNPSIEYSSDSSNPPIEYSSDSGNPPIEYSSSPVNEPSSSSNLNISGNSSSSSYPIASSSSIAVATPSSSSVSSTPSCVYQTSWCGGVAASSVKTASLNSATGSTICTFATSVSMLGNSNNLSVNGTKTSNCGNTGWGQQACTAVLANISKADGGYYIYAPDYYADFTTTGGTPNCSGGGIAPGVSSSAAANSSNSGGGSSSNSGNGGTPSYTPKPAGSQSGQTTQYWDACKPSCSWTSNSGGNPAHYCSITGSRMNTVSDADRSACDGGNAFTCMNQAPWKVGNISFGYVAVNDGKCGDCYQLDFPNGQVMVVMKSNIGGINGKFDIMIPGGGVGDFDALTRQVTNSGVSNPDMGERYGGFRGKCGWEYSTQSVNCVKQKCESVFANLPDLKAGCLWYANTLGTDNASWNNPNVKYQQVTCPKELTDRY